MKLHIFKMYCSQLEVSSLSPAKLVGQVFIFAVAKLANHTLLGKQGSLRRRGVNSIPRVRFSLPYHFAKSLRSPSPPPPPGQNDMGIIELGKRGGMTHLT